MKFLLLALLVGIAQANLIDEDGLNKSFELFKTKFDRFYENSFEENYRKSIFAVNLEFILEHNRAYALGQKTFTVAMNNFTDLTNAEFRKIYNGHRYNSQYSIPADDIFNDEDVTKLPATVDWTTKGLVTPIKNQGQCGSCWAFSAVASMEGQHAKKLGKLVSLSEQNLVDCSGAEGNMGCDGGLMDNAFRYVIINKGIDTEVSYSYKAVDENCLFKKTTVGATIKSYVDVKKRSEAALQVAVASIGPISVAIDASQSSFQFYKSGVYTEPECSTTFLDHGVTAVGYGKLNGTPYWKVKNSWGTSWGEEGYILMSRNKDNQCGIATQASYPVV